MKIFMTGATGFVGSVILKDLLAEGHDVRCLVRSGSEKKIIPPPTPSLQFITGDITDPSSYAPHMGGCDAVIHLVGIIREFPKQGITFEKLHVKATEDLINTAKKNGIERFLQMSALGAGPSARSQYHKTKYQAEEHLRPSGLNYTIFQPSVIYGPGDQFVNMLARMVRRNPITPLIGGGYNRLQPIALENVSQGFLMALREKRTSYRTYKVGGPEALTFKEILNTIKDILGIRRPNVRIPMIFIKPMVRLMERFPFFPLTSDQLIMLKEDNTCDPTLYFQHMKINPIRFREGIFHFLRGNI